MRERRYSGLIITSFYVPVEAKDVLEALDQLAKVEGVSRSELILRAIKEYVENHYPGNPQLTLPSIEDPRLLPRRYKAVRILRALKPLVQEYERDKRVRGSRAVPPAGIYELVEEGLKYYRVHPELRRLLNKALDLLGYSEVLERDGGE